VDGIIVLVGGYLWLCCFLGILMLAASVFSLVQDPRAPSLPASLGRVLGLLIGVTVCGSLLSGGLLALVVLRPQTLVKSLVVRDEQGGGSIGLSVVDGTARLELRDRKGNSVVLTPSDVSFSGERGKAAALGLSAGMGQLNLLGSVGKSVTALDGKVTTNQMEARDGESATTLEGGKVTVVGNGTSGQVSANRDGAAITLNSGPKRTVLAQDSSRASLDMSGNSFVDSPLVHFERTDYEANILFGILSGGHTRLGSQGLHMEGPNGSYVRIEPPYVELDDPTKGVYWCARNWLPLPPRPTRYSGTAQSGSLDVPSSGLPPITFLPLLPPEDREDWDLRCNGGR